jgi:hypothetical protein
MFVVENCEVMPGLSEDFRSDCLRISLGLGVLIGGIISSNRTEALAQAEWSKVGLHARRVAVQIQPAPSQDASKLRDRCNPKMARGFDEDEKCRDRMLAGKRDE